MQFTVLENVGIALLGSRKSEEKSRPKAFMDGMYTTAEELALLEGGSNAPWSNLAAGAAGLEPSYQKFASFSANGCFLAPPITLAGFTSGVVPNHSLVSSYNC